MYIKTTQPSNFLYLDNIYLISCAENKMICIGKETDLQSFETLLQQWFMTSSTNNTIYITPHDQKQLMRFRFIANPSAFFSKNNKLINSLPQGVGLQFTTSKRFKLAFHYIISFGHYGFSLTHSIPHKSLDLDYSNRPTSIIMNTNLDHRTIYLDQHPLHYFNQIPLLLLFSQIYINHHTQPFTTIIEHHNNYPTLSLKNLIAEPKQYPHASLFTRTEKSSHDMNIL
jgi:hypothetical protein